MRHSGRKRSHFSQHRQHIPRWVLLAVCVLVILSLCYGCAVQQMMYSARGTVIFLPEMPRLR